MQDTSQPSKARYYELLRNLPPERRMRAMLGLNRAVRELALAGIRNHHPTATEAELQVRLTVRLYGRDIAQRLFGSVPPDAR